MPNDGELLDLLLSWAGSADTARRILIDNSLRFYGVPAMNEEVGLQPIGSDQDRVRPRPRRRRLFAAAEG
jgi:hypothetical protein